MRDRKPQASKTLYRVGAVSALVAIAAVAGCDDLLDVNLPDAVTEVALEDPGTAALQVNSIMAEVECGYSSYAINAAGYSDNFQRISGSASAYAEYRDTPAGGGCDSGPRGDAWMNAFLTARGQGYKVYDRISAWTPEQVADREKLLAKAALYTAIPLKIFGEVFCETAIDAGPLLTPNQTLDIAAQWLDTALGHIATTGDFDITTAAGTQATSITAMVHGLKAQVLWAQGDLAGAAAEAAMVDDGFVAWDLREEGENRRNIVVTMQGGEPGLQAAGFLMGPVEVKTADNLYGVSVLGNNPVTGAPWPSPVPFTGYRDLAIDAATGRAVSDDGNPLTTADAGTVSDTRVPTAIDNTAGGDDYVPRKYTSAADDIPMVNWKEMRLIQAEYENEVNNDQSAAIAYVNELRTADGLPIVQGSYAAGADQDAVEDMIIEERRRALWLEGRFWPTKIQHVDKLWFPRNQGVTLNSVGGSYTLGGGVRVLMDEDEYQTNPNLTLADRGTGCAPAQAPVFN